MNDWGPAGVIVSGFVACGTALGVYVRGENAKTRLAITLDIAKALEPITVVVRKNELDIATLTERDVGVQARLSRHAERMRVMEMLRRPAVGD